MAARVENPMTIIETFRGGRPTYRLLCPDPAMSEFFDNWMYQVSKRRAWRTVKVYGPAVLLFLQYVQVLTDLHGGLTQLLLSEAIENYENFLVYGENSSIDMNRIAAKVLGSRNMGGSSIQKHFSGVNNFIDASEVFRKAMLQLQQTGYISQSLVTALPMITSTHVSAPAKIRAAIGKNSWLASCLDGGAKRIRQSGLVPSSKPSTIAHTNAHGGDDKVFPIDLCVTLIESTDCLRDKVLWSLLAACGCRVSEALTILREDLVMVENAPLSNSVVIIDPKTRIKELSGFMTDVQISKLSHKGRSSPQTYLIEPFASHFWINLDLYITEQREIEKARHRPVFHKFIFRNLIDGDPIPASYQAVWERFNAAAKAVTGESYGFHSLRHMYAYYLHNHCPNPFKPGTYGFDLGFVKKMLGHSSSKSVERYARKDGEMLRATMSAMNLMRMRDASYSTVKVQVEYLKKQIAHLESQLENQSKSQLACV